MHVNFVYIHCTHLCVCLVFYFMGFLSSRLLIKRAQGRRKFGMKNFKQRYFILTNKSLLYCKCKGGIPLCDIPLEDILAVERLQEQSFKMKYVSTLTFFTWLFFFLAFDFCLKLHVIKHSRQQQSDNSYY